MPVLWGECLGRNVTSAYQKMPDLLYSQLERALICPGTYSRVRKMFLEERDRHDRSIYPLCSTTFQYLASNPVNSGEDVPSGTAISSARMARVMPTKMTRLDRAMSSSCSSSKTAREK